MAILRLLTSSDSTAHLENPQGCSNDFWILRRIWNTSFAAGVGKLMSFMVPFANVASIGPVMVAGDWLGIFWDVRLGVGID